jgi:uncharacterized protein DUF6600/FecR-like protein
MRRALFAFPAALLLLAPAFANAADPPGRVGRLSYVDGTVSFHLANQGDWTPATVNYPVTTGESFWTDENSRAEIQVGPAELRLDQASQLDISRLDDGGTDVQLDQGVLNLHLWTMPAGEIVVTTPRGRAVIQAPGSYDIDAGQPDGDQPADQTQVTVLEGAAEFQSDAGSVNIDHSEAAVIGGDPANVQLVEANYSDFDNWALTRERREDVAQRPAYVPPTVTGYQDLDQYGSWGKDPQYGEVWYPNGVAADWAPYRYGHWGWVPPWGWTWIDDAPWGFAPFHYGRWVDRDDRWAWVPQDIPPQPVYAPALVAFIGGDGWGVDLAAGAAVAAIGWVALAPHEEYHPDFRASENWARGANGRDWNAKTYNVTNVTVNNYYNRQAATVVPAAAFTNAAPVQKATVKVAPDQLARTRTTATLTNYHPNAFARSGRADPSAVSATASQPNAEAKVAPQRVAIATSPAAAAAKVPTAPGPHRVAAAAHPVKNASVAPGGGTPPAQATSPTQPASQRAQGEAVRPTQPAPEHAQGGAAPPAQPTQPATREATREPNAPPANPHLAPHPLPPNQVTRNPQPGVVPTVPPQHQEANRPPEQARSAPQSTARIAPQSPATPSPPRTASVQPPRPNPAPQHPTAAPPPRTAAVQPPRPNPAPQHPAAPPPRTASVQPPRPGPAPQRPAAPPPPMQVAHPQQQTHIAPTPQAWSRAPGPPPQVARAPAPPPPRAAAPPPAAHPAAAPAPHPAAVPAPHPAAAAAHPAAPAKAPPQTPDKKKPPAQ